MVRGLEKYVAGGPSMPIVAIVQGSKASELDLPNGTVINNATNEILAKKGEEFVFVPVYYFQDWTVWDNDNQTLIKKTYDKSGVWSDGSAVGIEEVGWIGNTPPMATEAHNLVVVPVEELKKKHKNPEHELQHCIISFKKTSTKAGKALLNLINATCAEKDIADVFGGVYRIKVVKESNDKNTWLRFGDATFEKPLKEKVFPLLEEKYYQAEKDISALVQTSQAKAPQLAAAPQSKQVVETKVAEKPAVKIEEKPTVEAEVVPDDEDMPF